MMGPLVIIGQIFHQQRWAHLSPSVISLVKNAGPIQSHRYVHFPIVLGPLEIIEKILPATPGPLVIVGQIFHQKRWAHLSPSVIFLMKNAGPIQSHRCVHSPIVLGPLEIIDKIPPATLGPLVIIGQIFHWQRWAHLSPSVISLVKNAGPMQSHRYVHFPIVLGPLEIIDKISPATLGPLVIIGQIFHHQRWAHLSPSVRSLPNHTGPIGDHRQNIPLAMLGPLETIGATIVNNDGPTGDYRPNIPLATLGPFEPIGNIPCEECWAHSKPSVRSLPNHTGPIGDHRQNSTGNAGPIGDRRPNIPPATLGPLEPIGNIPCEECWANSKPSVRSLPNHTGPIGDHRQNFTGNAGPIGDHRPNIPPHQQRWAHLSPSVISHVKNAGPIQSHRYVHFQIVLGPLEIIDKILPATLGPLTIIGQIFHQKRWAHLSPSVISLVKNAGPIQSHWYVHFPIVLGPLEIIDKIPPATLGLLVIIGQIFHHQRWAHLSPSVIFLVKNAGPVQSPSVRSLPNRTGPIGDHRQNLTGNAGPIGDHRPNIPSATLGPFEPIGNIPCEECWAHSKPSVRSLPNRTGPIGDHRQNFPGNTGPIGDSSAKYSTSNAGPI